MKKGPYQHFKDAISSLEEVQTFLASCGHSEIFESLGNVIDLVVSMQPKSCVQISLLDYDEASDPFML